VSTFLFNWLEQPYKKQEFVLDEDVGAIVVLGAGRWRNLPEYQLQDQPSYYAMWRLRFGAHLAKQYNLPIIVSGGTVYPYETVSEATIGARFLRDELQVDEVWEEGNSRDTWQNAKNSLTLLSEKGIQKVAIVTHAYHMRRAELAFYRALKSSEDFSSITVVPMPTGFLYQTKSGWWDDYLPRSIELLKSRTALHEYLGLVFYYLRH
jgi:uncharacterized SAM-binding protein YcdF (DUF218 family)